MSAAYKAIDDLGGAVMRVVEWLGSRMVLAGRTFLAMAKPPYHFRQLMQQLDRVGFGSLPIVALTGLFTGLVFSMNTLNALIELQAEGMVAPSMTLSLSRELGPILTALLVAGRSGSAVATELGTMRVTEQIDAMTVMGVNPIAYLVAPRAIALLVTLPLLDGIFVFTGLYGSILAAEPFGITGQLFIQEALRMADANDLYVGMLKSLVFGFMIAVVAAGEGFSATGGAKGVGEAATRTVVITSLFILVLDYLMMLVLAPIMLGFDI
jgi:phospholipid/cholesterol/gamma-HCH transport system permease protein